MGPCETSTVFEIDAFFERKIKLFYSPTSPWFRDTGLASRRVELCFMARWGSKVLLVCCTDRFCSFPVKAFPDKYLTKQSF